MKKLISFEKINLFLLEFFLAIFPFYNLLKFKGYQISIFLLAMMLIIIFFEFVKGKKIFIPKISLSLFLFSFIYIVLGSFIYENLKNFSLRNFAPFIVFFIVFIIPNVIKKEKNLLLSMAVLFYSSVFSSVLILCEFLNIFHFNFIDIQLYSNGLKRVYGIGDFSNPNSFSILILTSMLIGFYLIFREKFFFRKIKYILGEALLSFVLILAVSRALIFSFLISLMITFFLFWKYFKLKYLLFTFLLIALIIVPFIGSNTMERVFSHQTSNRLSRWESGVKIFLNHPVIGVGNKNAKYLVYQQLYKEKKLFENDYIESPKNLHNLYVQALASTGFIGFMALLFLILNLFYFFIFSLKRRSSRIFSFLIISTFLLFNLTHSMFFVYSFWVFMGFFEAESRINVNLVQGAF